jgi:excinuclease ABC subunit B
MPATFELVSKFQPAGDQPQAIGKLAEGFQNGHQDQEKGKNACGKNVTTRILTQAAWHSSRL